MGDLQKFIGQQAPTTAVGVAYMYNGAVKMYQDFTTDHSSAASALRLPMGSTVGSDPYFSLTT